MRISTLKERVYSPASTVEQISNYELAVNLKTANSIGVTLPTSILLRADQVIERESMSPVGTSPTNQTMSALRCLLSGGEQTSGKQAKMTVNDPISDMKQPPSKTVLEKAGPAPIKVSLSLRRLQCCCDAVCLLTIILVGENQQRQP